MASECLIENCIMWADNKVNVMRGCGGGNVVAYCYTDDAYGGNYPDSPEAGINAGHFTTPSMALLEGNYSQNFKGDSYWGNSIYITVFRNHLTAKRAAHPPLNNYTYWDGSKTEIYIDLFGRTACDVQGYSYHHNFVGNVLGMKDQVLISDTNPEHRTNTQTAFAYEYMDRVPGDIVPIWQFGSWQDTDGSWKIQPGAIDTQLRQGNWDWFTKKQRWHGIGGSGDADTSAPQSIPNSMYLTAKPAFFGSNPWPWVDPATGATTVLPAKARFDAGTPNDGSARSPPRKQAKR
jgi:hypothetical protein